MLSIVRNPIRRFYVYRFFTAEGFVFPVVMLLLLDRGLTLGGMGIATGAFFAGTLVGEIPTGYIGDRIGRRNGLLASSILIALTHVAFSFAATLAAFVAIYLFWGVAATFRSGTTDAWLYDTFTERDETGLFTKARGRSAAMYYASAGITAIVGGPCTNWIHDSPSSLPPSGPRSALWSVRHSPNPIRSTTLAGSRSGKPVSHSRSSPATLVCGRSCCSPQRRSS